MFFLGTTLELSLGAKGVVSAEHSAIREIRERARKGGRWWVVGQPPWPKFLDRVLGRREAEFWIRPGSAINTSQKVSSCGISGCF